MDTLYLLFGLATFIAVALFMEGVFAAWNNSRGPEAKRITRRLQLISATASRDQQNNPLLKQRLLSNEPAFQKLLQSLPHVHQLDKLIEQAGLKFNLSQFCLASLICAVLIMAVAMMLAVPLVISLALCSFAAAIPWLFLLRKKAQRFRKLEVQLPDALDLMSRALRAGHALPSAIKMVGEDMTDPIAGEFSIMFDEINYGIEVGDALHNLAVRIPNTDVGYFVVAVQIQRETGGNLTEILGNIAGIIRARIKLFGQIKTFSAESRLSAWILSLLPFGLAILINLVNPAFMEILWKDPLGPQILTVMGAFMIVGVFWMRKIIRIRV